MKKLVNYAISEFEDKITRERGFITLVHEEFESQFEEVFRDEDLKNDIQNPYLCQVLYKITQNTEKKAESYLAKEIYNEEYFESCKNEAIKSELMKFLGNLFYYLNINEMVFHTLARPFYDKWEQLEKLGYLDTYGNLTENGKKYATRQG